MLRAWHSSMVISSEIVFSRHDQYSNHSWHPFVYPTFYFTGNIQSTVQTCRPGPLPINIPGAGIADVWLVWHIFLSPPIFELNLWLQYFLPEICRRSPSLALLLGVTKPVTRALSIPLDLRLEYMFSFLYWWTTTSHYIYNYCASKHIRRCKDWGHLSTHYSDRHCRLFLYYQQYRLRLIVKFHPLCLCHPSIPHFN